MTSSMIIDLVALAIIIGFAIYGGIKGFAATVLGVLSWGIGLLLTWRLYPLVAKWLVNAGLRDTLQTFFAEKLKLDRFKDIINASVGSLIGANGLEGLDGIIGAEGIAKLETLLAANGLEATTAGLEALSGEDFVSGMGGLAALATLSGVSLAGLETNGLSALGVLQNIQQAQGTATLSALKLPKFLLKWLAEHNTPEQYARYGVDNLGDYVGVYVADVTVNIIAVLLTFVVITVVLRLLVALFEKVNDIPAIGRVNTFLGVISGVFMGLMVIWLILTLLTFLGITTKLEAVMEAMDASRLCSFLNNKNPLLKLIESAIG